MREHSILGLLPPRYRRTSGTNGGEWNGPCLYCGTGQDRFCVWPNQGDTGRFWCRVCERSGDGIQLARDLHGLSFAEACRAVGADRSTSAGQATYQAPPPPTTEPPPEEWRDRALALVKRAEAALWSERGASAVGYLLERGLTESTIREARLGLCRRGITIPWFIGGVLWAVRIRRQDVGAGQSRYIFEKGSRGAALYGADTVRFDAPVVLVEGEFDALSVRQETGLAAVATGGISGGRRTRWIAKLSGADPLLVAFDAEPCGEEAAAFWTERLPRARRWCPTGKDASAMLQDGDNLTAWLAPALEGTAVHDGDGDRWTRFYRERYGEDELARLAVWPAEERRLILWLWWQGHTRDRVLVGHQIDGEPFDEADLRHLVETLRNGPTHQPAQVMASTVLPALYAATHA